MSADEQTQAGVESTAGGDAVARLAEAVEGSLERALPPRDATAAAEFGAERLVESMRYSLRTPGKRLRPLLLLSAVEAVGAAAEPFVEFAAGLEMIHAYSLIHDDLPAMDDDDLRRGAPTNHVVFGDGMAILAGDGLLTEAFAVMVRPIAAAVAQSRAIGEIADAAGRDGMVGGQAADLLAEGRDPDEDVLRSIHRRKTGALILVAVRAGGLLAGASSDELARLSEFGGRFGLAFQIADDIKDEVSPTAVTGKHGGGDRSAGKMTYPALYGVEASRARCRAELDAALEGLRDFGERAALLRRVALDSVAPAFASREPGP